MRTRRTHAAILLLENILAQIGAVAADVDILWAFHHWPDFAAGLAAETTGGHLATAKTTVACVAAPGIRATSAADRPVVLTTIAPFVVTVAGVIAVARWVAFWIWFGWLFAHEVLQLKYVTAV